MNDDEIQIAKENTVTKLTRLLLPRVCVWEGEGAECINERKELVSGSVEYFFSCVNSELYTLFLSLTHSECEQRPFKIIYSERPAKMTSVAQTRSVKIGIMSL